MICEKACCQSFKEKENDRCFNKQKQVLANYFVQRRVCDFRKRSAFDTEKVNDQNNLNTIYYCIQNMMGK